MRAVKKGSQGQSRRTIKKDGQEGQSRRGSERVAVNLQHIYLFCREISGRAATGCHLCNEVARADGRLVLGPWPVLDSIQTKGAELPRWPGKGPTCSLCSSIVQHD